MSVDSEETFALSSPVVPTTRAGASRLGSAYWREVERSTLGTVRVRGTAVSLELRVLGRGPVLLRFGVAQVEVGPTGVSCTFPILGGLLARGAGGELAFDHQRASGWQLRLAIRGFSPRLVGRRGSPSWTGLVYSQVQARLHRAIGRRYIARLARESRP
jgi:hypothetical protein